MQPHVRAIAVLFLIFGGLLAMGGLVSAAFFGGLGTLIGLSQNEGALIGALALQLTGAALTIFLLALAVPSLACGWGLLKRRRWARTLGIILGAIALVNFWLGTAFGIYVLWVLLNKRTETIFGD